jgi:tetratricopeptide (TPR) repeat protein
MLYGRGLRDQKKYSLAASQFNVATQKRPDSKEAWNELITMLMLLDDYPRALAALDRVQALGGEIPGHYFFRAIILDKTKQLKPALEAYQKFLAVADGKFPDQEFQARQRARIIQRELSKR